MLTNPYVIAVVVPLALIMCGALAKKLVRGSAWSRKDFFLGVELALAAMTAGLINFLDLSKAAAEAKTQIAPNDVMANGVFVAICFFILLWILATHQDWGEQDSKVTKQVVWLGFVCNAVGAGLVIGFILLVKGIA